MMNDKCTGTSYSMLTKTPTGITGLDEITNGGLPANRTTLICGGPGCGKTALAMEFLVRGASHYDEPGLFFSFEESTSALIENFRSFGFDIQSLIERNRLKLSHVELSQGEIIESGVFSLDGLLIRLQQDIEEIGAKRVALDTLETLFTTLNPTKSLRSEIGRILHWLRDKGITTLITGERGGSELTRHGFEEYVSDCVVLLDHRVSDQISKRRLRIVKYRGSAHGMDEYPFLIGESGISVFPITSLHLEYPIQNDRVSTGVNDLDKMFEGQGYYRGSSILVSGKAGSGKSTLAAAYTASACERGERCLYLAFEESAGQLTRNMRSVGIDLDRWEQKGLLTIQAFRPTFCGLEEHLVAIRDSVRANAPTSVVMDPITSFISIGAPEEVKAMLIRVMDHLKKQGITLLITALTAGTAQPDETNEHVSSMIDTWISMNLTAVRHSRRREISIIKSRGMEHSLNTNEMILSSRGLNLRSLKQEKDS